MREIPSNPVFSVAADGFGADNLIGESLGAAKAVGAVLAKPGASVYISKQ